MEFSDGNLGYTNYALSWELSHGLFDLEAHTSLTRLLDSLVVECWLRVREVPGLIPSQGLRHTKYVITMVPVVALFSTED